MFDKVDVRRIVFDHYGTLRVQGSAKTSRADLALFVGLPLVGVGISWWFGFKLQEAAVNVLITALSILAGLLFNLLVLITDVGSRLPAPVGRTHAQQFVREVYSNVSYAILCSFAAIVPLVVQANLCQPSVMWSTASVALVLHFALTLLMVLKRIHNMLSLIVSSSAAKGGA